MIIRRRIGILNLIINTIFILIWLKLIFSYLSVKLSYFQRNLIPNIERFNFLGVSEDFSNKIDFLILPLLLYGVIRYFKYAGNTKSIILVSFFMYALNLITGLMNGISLLDSLTFSFKLFAPIYLFCLIIIYYDKTGIGVFKIFKTSINIVFVLTIIGLIFFNPSFNRLEVYLPIYFDGIHTHSYILSISFIGVSYLIYRNNKKYLLVLFLLFSFAFLYFGYGVRTVLIMYLMYIITIFFLISDVFKVFFVKFLVIAPLFVLLFLLFKSEINIGEFSSGRTSMYLEKLNQLSNYNFFEWLFGRGYGSDLILIDDWWWDKKGSHSDLLTYIIENGVIYLFFVLMLFYKFITLAVKNNIIFIVIILGAFFSSVISNGIAVRPIAGYLFFLTLGYIYIDLKERKKQLDHN